MSHRHDLNAFLNTAEDDAIVSGTKPEATLPFTLIFLHQIRAKGLGGLESTRYEIVDGQQRIRALADFHSDKFPLLEASDKKLRLPNSLRKLPAPWGKRRFSELAEQLPE